MTRVEKTVSLPFFRSRDGDNTRPGQTRKKPKDLSTREREERGRGEGGGLYIVYMCERGGGGEKSVVSEALSLLSYTLRYVSLADLDRLCQFELRRGGFVYYESIKRELKTRPIYECRSDNTLKRGGAQEIVVYY